jgi:hypothetical protein
MILHIVMKLIPLMIALCLALAACDQVALDWLRRQCSAFGPLGDKRPR